METTATDIINFVQKNSWFEFEYEDENEILFSTRANGNVGDETPGQKDLNEAARLKREFAKHYPTLTIDIEEVDEWVHLTVNLNN